MTTLGKRIMWVVVIIVVGIGIYLLQRPAVTVAPVEDVVVDDSQNRAITGNINDLVSFSILPNTKVSGIMSYKGIIKNAWFFEANILINILDNDKNLLLASNGVAISDWMTVEPVAFEGNVDFTALPKGPAYIEIRNDNPAGPDEGVNKFVLIPIIIE
jgi:hypothetical protein